MLQVKCIQKIKENNITKAYILKDSKGMQKIVTSDQLKQAISNNLITVTNLKLTKDNRLIDHIDFSEEQSSQTIQQTQQQPIQQEKPKFQTKTITITRTHKIHIKKTSNKKIFNILDKACLNSKNLYNLALYNERQIYFDSDKNIFKSKFLSYTELYTLLKDTDTFKQLNQTHSGLSQQTLKLVDQTINSFKRSIETYIKTPSKFKGIPKLPKYLNKNSGRQILDLTYMMFNIKNNQLIIKLFDQELTFNIPSQLKNIKVKSSKFSTDDILNPTFTLDQVRVVPQHQSYNIELIYTKEIQIQKPTTNKVASIDIGLDNLVTLVYLNSQSQPLILSGKYLKSYNKNFNKKLSNIQSKLDTAINNKNQSQIKKYTNIKQNLHQKRNNYFNTNMHQIASYIINTLKQTNTTILIIGYNPQWKQNSKLSRKVNQTFIQIPHLKLIQILEYKCKELGIAVSRPEEPCTSGTSFLDQELPTNQNYNKKRRIKRGLFRSNNHTLINADVNAAYQIVKEYQPKFNSIPPDQFKYQHPKILILPKTFINNQQKLA